MITSWDDERRLTDADHGITAADVADERLSLTIYRGNGAEEGRYFWELGDWEAVTFYPDGTPDDWEAVTFAGGIADTEQAARAAGEAAKETYLRGLNRQ